MQLFPTNYTSLKSFHLFSSFLIFSQVFSSCAELMGFAWRYSYVLYRWTKTISSRRVVISVFLFDLISSETSPGSFRVVESDGESWQTTSVKCRPYTAKFVSEISRKCAYFSGSDWKKTKQKKPPKTDAMEYQSLWELVLCINVRLMWICWTP